MNRKIQKLAVAAVILIVAGLFIWIGNEQSVVWAEVVKKVEDISVKSYSLDMTFINNKNKTQHKRRVYHWDIYRRREVRDSNTIYIFDLGKKDIEMLVLRPEAKAGKKVIYKGQGPKKNYSILRTVASLDGRSDTKDLGQKTINSINVQGFHIPDKINNFTIWVDIKTKLPIYVELLQENSNRTIVLENFDFETKLDESLFSTDAPEGYTLKEVVEE